MSLSVKPANDGRPLFGGWCSLPSALSAEALARGGYDWVLIDMQHGVADFATVCEMIRAVDGAGVPPLVRVPWNEPGIIGRVLDAGAMGLIVPMIQTADDARRAVEASLYPPVGRRSFGPVRPVLRDGPGYVAAANEQIAVLPMIETAEALASIDEILAIPGVAGLFVGPMDLSVALGLPPRDNDGAPAFDAALDAVVAGCRRHGKIAAAYSSRDVAPTRAAQGFDLISVTNDAGAVIGSARSDAAFVKANAKRTGTA
ncbi:MAG: aldolase [Phenylobacterium zucineum]|nr:MAG: aldolase [Phenylobacterium zucineum]